MHSEYYDGKLSVKSQEDVSELPLEVARERLGGIPLIHRMNSFDTAKAILGEQLIRKGCISNNSASSKRISRHFVCTDCHNLKREYENPGSESADDRLDYAMKHNLPYLQGASFWGMYNRQQFFSDDYSRKYGEGIKMTLDTLVNAIRFCARYCSSGRELENWELEAIMHYFKKNELKLKDLKLDKATLTSIENYSEIDQKMRVESLSKLENAYRRKFSATFLDVIDLQSREYGVHGDPVKGEAIFKQSCLFCHKINRVSRFYFNNSRLAARWFWRKMDKMNHKSIYYIVRHGTDGHNGEKSYMPLFTKEKMSDQQLEDLVAYVRKNAGK